MKRIYYVSRFSRRLTEEDIERIREASDRNNRELEITGFLVCLGNTFFQALEGPADMVDHLYYSKIAQDPRHTDVVCLKTEIACEERIFEGWYMKAYNLNDDAQLIPTAFREMLAALLESHHTFAQYTQSGILEMLEKGINPVSIRPRKVPVTVFYSDIIGFSRFAEHIDADTLIELVNSHAEICSLSVAACSGQVNKLTGDGVLAYFSGNASDEALDASIQVLAEMARLREEAPSSSPHKHLYGGIGLAHGLVYEGNVGTELKRDFTILGNTVNLASRIESLTRNLDVRITFDENVVLNAEEDFPFRSLGKHLLRGQSAEIPLFTLDNFTPLRIEEVYRNIEDFIGAAKVFRSSS